MTVTNYNKIIKLPNTESWGETLNVLSYKLLYELMKEL